MQLNGRKVRGDDAKTSGRSATLTSSKVEYGSKKAHRKLRLITAQALDGRTRASQQFNAIVAAVTSDLGGTANLTEIERHLITSFAGAAILQGHQLAKLLSGGDVDINEYSSITVSMLRSVSRLGTDRRGKNVTPPRLDEYLDMKAQAEAAE